MRDLAKAASWPLFQKKIHPNYAVLFLCSLGWTLVFKVVSGSHRNAFDFYNSEAENEKDVFGATNKQLMDYKNRIVLQWGEFKPSEVGLRSIYVMHS